MSIREESVVFAGRRGEDVDVEGACTRKVGERSEQLVPQTHLEWLRVKAMSSSQRPYQEKASRLWTTAAEERLDAQTSREREARFNSQRSH